MAKHNILPVVVMIYGIVGALFFLALVPSVHRLDVGIPVEDEFKLMSTTMLDASQAAYGASEKIAETKTFLVTASAAAESAGESISLVSGFAGFSVMGWQPFAQAQEPFTKMGGSITKMGADLSMYAYSLDTNAEQISRLGDDFKEMSVKLSEVSTKFTMPFQKLASGVLVYLISLHVIISLLGYAMKK